MAKFGKQLVASKERVSALLLGAGLFMALVVVFLGSSANADDGSGLQAADSKIAKVSAPAMIKPKTMKKPKKKSTPAPTSTATPAPVASSPAPAPAQPKQQSSPKRRYEAPEVLR